MDIKRCDVRQYSARAKMVTDMLFGDFSDADLLVRPVAGANHVSLAIGPCHRVAELLRRNDQAGQYASRLPRGSPNSTRKRRPGPTDRPAFCRSRNTSSLLDSQRQAFADLLADGVLTVVWTKQRPRKCRLCTEDQRPGDAGGRTRNDALRTDQRGPPKARQAGDFLTQ